MRISDWSSDVCSSDLVVPALRAAVERHPDQAEKPRNDRHELRQIAADILLPAWLAEGLCIHDHRVDDHLASPFHASHPEQHTNLTCMDFHYSLFIQVDLSNTANHQIIQKPPRPQTKQNNQQTP